MPPPAITTRTGFAAMTRLSRSLLHQPTTLDLQIYAVDGCLSGEALEVLHARLAPAAGSHIRADLSPRRFERQELAVVALNDADHVPAEPRRNGPRPEPRLGRSEDDALEFRDALAPDQPAEIPAA